MTTEVIRLRNYDEVIASSHKQEEYVDPGDIDSLCQVWEGKQVWAVLDGMWRQVTVTACCPSREPGLPWSFILHSKHDSWRHVVQLVPTTGSIADFEDLQQLDYIDVPPPPPREEQVDLLPAESPLAQLGAIRCPIHPNVSTYIRQMIAVMDAQSRQLEELREELIAKSNQCEDLASKNNVLSQTLHQAQLDEEAMRQSLLAADNENSSLRKDLTELRDAYSKRVSSLESKINAANEEMNQLSDELRSSQETCRALETECEELRKSRMETIFASGESEAERRLVEANKRNCSLDELNRKLQDRVTALEEALQKTVAAENEGSRLQAAAHSRECAALQREIDHLLHELSLRGGKNEIHPASNRFSTDDVVELHKLREEIYHLAAAKKTAEESFVQLEKRYNLLLSSRGGVPFGEAAEAVDSAIVSRELAEATTAREEDLRSHLESLRQLSNRVTALEEKWNRPSSRPEITVEDVSVDPRRDVRDVVRLATSLKNETLRIKRRIDELEKDWTQENPQLSARLSARRPESVTIPGDVNAAVAAAASKIDRDLESSEESTWWGGKKTYIRKSKDELRTMFLREAQLVAENARLTLQLNAYKEPTATTAQVDMLRQDVHSLDSRLQSIVAAHAATTKGAASWDSVARLQEKEKENDELRHRLAAAEAEKTKSASYIASNVQPILSENAKLREKLQEYVRKIEDLEKSKSSFW